MQKAHDKNVIFCHNFHSRSKLFN